MDRDRLETLAKDFGVSVDIVQGVVDLYGDDIEAVRKQLNSISVDQEEYLGGWD